MTYKTSQIGWLYLAIMLPGTLFLIPLYVFQWGNNPLPFAAFLMLFLFLGLATALFCKMTLIVKASQVQIIYGIGLVRFKLQIDQLLRTEEIKTPWYWGVGIRYTPKGKLYSIHGTKALRIEYI